MARASSSSSMCNKVEQVSESVEMNHLQPRSSGSTDSVNAIEDSSQQRSISIHSRATSSHSAKLSREADNPPHEEPEVSTSVSVVEMTTSEAEPSQLLGQNSCIVSFDDDDAESSSRSSSDLPWSLSKTNAVNFVTNESIGYTETMLATISSIPAPRIKFFKYATTWDGFLIVKSLLIVCVFLLFMACLYLTVTSQLSAFFNNFVDQLVNTYNYTFSFLSLCWFLSYTIFSNTIELRSDRSLMQQGEPSIQNIDNLGKDNTLMSMRVIVMPGGRIVSLAVPQDIQLHRF